MPTNVPPQYHDAEERFRQAKSAPAKIAALEEMLAIVPKHKGTDHLRAELRGRLSRLMEELEGRPRGRGGGRVEPFSLPREGAGRAVLVGPAGVGKSLLLARATGAQTRVGHLAMGVEEPLPGMLFYGGVPIQLVDTPPISNPKTQGRLYGLLRNSDVVIIVVDLGVDAVAQVRNVLSELEAWGFRPAPGGMTGADRSLVKQMVLVGNRADVSGALDQLQALQAAFGGSYPIVMASAAEEVGFEDLGRELFRALKVIRVHTKSPRIKLEELNRSRPLVLPQGSTVGDAAEKLHKNLGRRVRYAVLWGESGRFEGQQVGRGHVLSDEDVIELHA